MVMNKKELDAKVEEVKREGYLVKQGGARGGFKNWKRRWFVLRHDCLYYYKAKPIAGDEKALLGVIPLSSAAVSDMPSTAPSAADAQTSGSTECFLCNKPFSMINKKRDCQRCGECFCKNCNTTKVLLPSPSGGTTPYRICAACYLELLDEDMMNVNVENWAVSQSPAHRRAPTQLANDLGIFGSTAKGKVGEFQGKYTNAWRVSE
jgi:hypothetical protein